jgi:hypothetical protein
MASSSSVDLTLVRRKVGEAVTAQAKAANAVRAALAQMAEEVKAAAAEINGKGQRE